MNINWNVYYQCHCVFFFSQICNECNGNGECFSVSTLEKAKSSGGNYGMGNGKGVKQETNNYDESESDSSDSDADQAVCHPKKLKVSGYQHWLTLLII